jgi:hypothetical protein
MPKVSSPLGVTPKQDRFCQSLVKHKFDHVLASREAYKGQVNPISQGLENLKKPNVIERIQRMAFGAGIDPDGVEIALGVKNLAYDKDVEPKTRLDSFRTLAEMLQLIGRPALIAQQFNQAENGTLNVKDLAAAFTDDQTPTSSNAPTQ